MCCLLFALLCLVRCETVLLCFARFLSKWRETALLVFLDATQAGMSCTFHGFCDDGIQRKERERERERERVVWLDEARAMGMTVEMG